MAITKYNRIWTTLNKVYVLIKRKFKIIAILQMPLNY